MIHYQKYLKKKPAGIFLGGTPSGISPEILVWIFGRITDEIPERIPPKISDRYFYGIFAETTNKFFWVWGWHPVEIPSKCAEEIPEGTRWILANTPWAEIVEIMGHFWRDPSRNN